MSLELRACTFVYWLQKVFAVGMFVFLFSWIFGFAGGVGFQDEAHLEFNFHPMLMGLGLVVLNGEAITVYRGQRKWPKARAKLVHGLLQGTAFLLSVLALKAAFDSHNYAKPKPIPNLYSFHSWLGITTFALFLGQLVGGTAVYALPYASISLRKTMMPIHRLSGTLIFILVLASVMLGYSEKAAFAFKCWTVQGELCAMMVFGNLFALCTVLYAACVLVVVVNPVWLRKPLPTEVMTPLSPERHHDD